MRGVGLRVFTKRKLRDGLKPQGFVKELQRIKNVASFANGFEGSEHMTQLGPDGGTVFVVYSQWRSERDWEHWLQSPARLTWQGRIKGFVSGEEEHLVYTAADHTPPWLM